MKPTASTRVGTTIGIAVMVAAGLVVLSAAAGVVVSLWRLILG